MESCLAFPLADCKTALFPFAEDVCSASRLGGSGKQLSPRSIVSHAFTHHVSLLLDLLACSCCRDPPRASAIFSSTLCSYYVNSATGATQWEVPTAPAVGGGAAEPASVRASHILVKHTGSRRPSSWRCPVVTMTKDEALSKLTKIRAAIVSGSARFEDVARVESDCSSAAKGGDLGVFGRGSMQKPFEDATYALKVVRHSHSKQPDGASSFGPLILTVSSPPCLRIHDAAVSPHHRCRSPLLLCRAGRAVWHCRHGERRAHHPAHRMSQHQVRLRRLITPRRADSADSESPGLAQRPTGRGGMMLTCRRLAAYALLLTAGMRGHTAVAIFVSVKVEIPRCNSAAIRPISEVEEPDWLT